MKKYNTDIVRDGIELIEEVYALLDKASLNIEKSKNNLKSGVNASYSHVKGLISVSLDKCEDTKEKCEYFIYEVEKMINNDEFKNNSEDILASGNGPINQDLTPSKFNEIQSNNYKEKIINELIESGYSEKEINALFIIADSLSEHYFNRSEFEERKKEIEDRINALENTDESLSLTVKTYQNILDKAIYDSDKEMYIYQDEVGNEYQFTKEEFSVIPDLIKEIKEYKWSIKEENEKELASLKEELKEINATLLNTHKRDFTYQSMEEIDNRIKELEDEYNLLCSSNENQDQNEIDKKMWDILDEKYELERVRNEITDKVNGYMLCGDYYLLSDEELDNGSSYDINRNMTNIYEEYNNSGLGNYGSSVSKEYLGLIIAGIVNNGFTNMDMGLGNNTGALWIDCNNDLLSEETKEKFNDSLTYPYVILNVPNTFASDDIDDFMNWSKALNKPENEKYKKIFNYICNDPNGGYEAAYNYIVNISDYLDQSYLLDKAKNDYNKSNGSYSAAALTTLLSLVGSQFEALSSNAVKYRKMISGKRIYNSDSYLSTDTFYKAQLDNATKVSPIIGKIWETTYSVDSVLVNLMTAKALGGTKLSNFMASTFNYGGKTLNNAYTEARSRNVDQNSSMLYALLCAGSHSLARTLNVSHISGMESSFNKMLSDGSTINTINNTLLKLGLNSNTAVFNNASNALLTGYCMLNHGIYGYSTAATNEIIRQMADIAVCGDMSKFSTDAKAYSIEHNSNNSLFESYLYATKNAYLRAGSAGENALLTSLIVGGLTAPTVESVSNPQSQFYAKAMSDQKVNFKEAFTKHEYKWTGNINNMADLFKAVQDGEVDAATAEEVILNKYNAEGKGDLDRTDEGKEAYNIFTKSSKGRSPTIDDKWYNVKINTVDISSGTPKIIYDSIIYNLPAPGETSTDGVVPESHMNLGKTIVNTISNTTSSNTGVTVMNSTSDEKTTGNTNIIVNQTPTTINPLGHNVNLNGSNITNISSSPSSEGFNIPLPFPSTRVANATADVSGISGLPTDSTLVKNATSVLFDASVLPLISKNPKRQAALDKIAKGEPLNINDKINLGGRDEVVKEINGYALKSDHAYRVTSVKAWEEYEKKGAVTSDKPDFIEGENNGGIDWYLGGSALPTGKYSSKNGTVVIEAPADKNYFTLASDNGLGMAKDISVRHIKSTGKTNPVPLSMVKIIAGQDALTAWRTIKTRTLKGMSDDFEVAYSPKEFDQFKGKEHYDAAGLYQYLIENSRLSSDVSQADFHYAIANYGEEGKVLNTGATVDPKNITNPIQAAKEFAEGSKPLENLLLNLWDKGYQTHACCSGDNGESIPYVSFRVENEKEYSLYKDIFDKMSDKYQVLFFPASDKGNDFATFAIYGKQENPTELFTDVSDLVDGKFVREPVAPKSDYIETDFYDSLLPEGSKLYINGRTGDVIVVSDGNCSHVKLNGEPVESLIKYAVSKLHESTDVTKKFQGVIDEINKETNAKITNLFNVGEYKYDIITEKGPITIDLSSFEDSLDYNIIVKSIKEACNYPHKDGAYEMSFDSEEDTEVSAPTENIETGDPTQKILDLLDDDFIDKTVEEQKAAISAITDYESLDVYFKVNLFKTILERKANKQGLTTKDLAKLGGEGKVPQSILDEANIFATEVANKAKNVEPEITALMNSFEADDCILIGLENKLKSINSIARKIVTDSNKYGTDLKESADRIGDSVRYTMIIDPNNYTDKSMNVLSTLIANGYTITRAANTWNNPYYKGLNTSVVSLDGVVFELQFHTTDSYIIKDCESHVYYEIRRNEYVSDDFKDIATEIQRLYTSTIPVPKGVLEADYSKMVSEKEDNITETTNGINIDKSITDTSIEYAIELNNEYAGSISAPVSKSGKTVDIDMYLTDDVSEEDGKSIISSIIDDIFVNKLLDGKKISQSITADIDKITIKIDESNPIMVNIVENAGFIKGKTGYYIDRDTALKSKESLVDSEPVSVIKDETNLPKIVSSIDGEAIANKMLSAGIKKDIVDKFTKSLEKAKDVMSDCLIYDASTPTQNLVYAMSNDLGDAGKEVNALLIEGKSIDEIREIYKDRPRDLQRFEDFLANTPSGRFINSLNTRELRAFRQYSGAEILKINNAARKVQNNSPYIIVVDDMSDAIKASPKIDRNMVVYRGDKYSALKHYKIINELLSGVDLNDNEQVVIALQDVVGLSLTDAGFLSTSPGYNTSFAPNRQFVFDIITPSNSDGAYINQISDFYNKENEYLFNCGTTQRILDVFLGNDGKVHFLTIVE